MYLFLHHDLNKLANMTVLLIRKHKHNCYCAQEILSGLRQPVSVVHCGDGSQRLFILEKEGFVRILTHDMELLKEPFLDIHKLVQTGIKVRLMDKVYLHSKKLETNGIFVVWILYSSTLTLSSEVKGQAVSFAINDSSAILCRQLMLEVCEVMLSQKTFPLCS